MLTNAGGSYSRWKDIAITRFREDTTCDNFGIFCYLRDVKSGEVWSTTYQPTLKQPLHYEAVFSDGRVEYRRHDHDFDVHTEIVVSPEDDIELRRATITNHSRSRKTIDVTSYAEIVITYPASDKIHPAFPIFSCKLKSSNSAELFFAPDGRVSKKKKIPGCFT